MELQKAVLPRNYDIYVFDLYGTLVDIRTREDAASLWEKLALFYGFWGAAYQPQELRAAYRELVTEKESSLKKEQNRRAADAHESSPEIELTEVFRDLFARKGVQADRELALHAGQFFRILSMDFLKLYPGTARMLTGLKAEGRQLYLLSNAQRIFTEYEMRCLGIYDFFDGILISSDHRIRKPDPGFFALLTERFGVDPGRALFVGNDSRNDIEAAAKAGYDTFYVRSDISPAGDDTDIASYKVLDFFGW